MRDRETKPQFMAARPKARQVLINRNPLPEVNKMLADAYETLATQLVHFRDHGNREKFDVKDATAFNKLITSLTTLQETERKNAALLELGKLSPEELSVLAKQSAAMLEVIPGK